MFRGFCGFAFVVFVTALRVLLDLAILFNFGDFA